MWDVHLPCWGVCVGCVCKRRSGLSRLYWNWCGLTKGWSWVWLSDYAKLGWFGLRKVVELWCTMPWSWLVSVAPAGCGVASIFWARWREPYRESVEVHWKRASSPSKKSNCRVRSGLELYMGGRKKASHVPHQFSFPELCCPLVVLRLQWFKKSLSFSGVVFMWNIQFYFGNTLPKICFCNGKSTISSMSFISYAIDYVSASS